MWRFTALAVLALVSATSCQTYPSSVVIPSSSMSDVTLVCIGTPPVNWRVNGTDYNDANPPIGIVVITKQLDDGILNRTLTLQKTKFLSYNGSSFQCAINQNFSSVPTAYLIVFGIDRMQEVLLCTNSTAIFVNFASQVLPQSRCSWQQPNYLMV